MDRPHLVGEDLRERDLHLPAHRVHGDELLVLPVRCGGVTLGALGQPTTKSDAASARSEARAACIDPA